MADLDLRAEKLNIKFIRGDVVAFDLRIMDKSVTPSVPLADLPTTGWRAQVRVEAGESVDPPLASFVIDASEVDTTSILHLVLEAADSVGLPEATEFDVENTITQFTYQRGTLTIDGQVSQ
jgi:hypothetical protein